jgi:DNA invertase Pin-like site-specific DNA recombinase
MAKAGTAVAVYVRLSQDRDGTKDSIRRQEADCRALAKARGWRVAEVFTDRDLSAFNGKRRPAFDRMLETVEAGRAVGVLAWKVDRIGRRTADVVSLVDRLRRAGGFVATCDGLDSSTPVGKSVVQVASIFAELESENTSSRTRRAKLEAARQGRPSGGGRRAFGYTPDGMSLKPTEAKAIARAADDVLAGTSLRQVARKWNETGTKTAEGNDWQPPAVRRVLISARIAGLREYRGEIIGDAAWPAIIDRATHERLRALLLDPTRRTSRSDARRYLLSAGLSVCGRCGSPLVAAPKGSGVRTYACRAAKRVDGCGGVRVSAEFLDEIVTEAVLFRLDSPKVAQARRRLHRTDPSATLVRQLAADESALEDLARVAFVDRRIGQSEYLAARDALASRIEQARSELARSGDAGVLEAIPRGTELRETWETFDLDRRRSIIAAIVDRVVVQPIGRGARTVDHPERVDVRWRT